jgi:hypothetical protein
VLPVVPVPLELLVLPPLLVRLLVVLPPPVRLLVPLPVLPVPQARHKLL